MRALRSVAVGSVAVAACVVAAVAGCGGSESEAAGVDALRSYFQQAQETKKTVIMTSMDKGSGPEDKPMTLVCKAQLTPTKASDCTAPESTFHMITVPDAIYLPATSPTSGKPWRKLHPGDKNSALISSQMSDDRLLAPGVATVVGSASDQVNGKTATRYDLEADAKALFEVVLKSSMREMPQEMKDRMMQSVTGTKITAQIWIGDDKLPLKQVVNMPPIAGKSASTQTVTYSDWGAPLNIAAPPADQVMAAN